MKMKKDMDLFLSPVSAFLFFSGQFESVYVVFTLEILDSNTIDKANLKVQQGSKPMHIVEHMKYIQDKSFSNFAPLFLGKFVILIES